MLLIVNIRLIIVKVLSLKCFNLFNKKVVLDLFWEGVEKFGLCILLKRYLGKVYS